LVGVIVGLILMRLRKAEISAPMPFGPYLAIAGWIAVLWGGQITDFYLQSVGFR
ncbi:prepilin peptidase, partial [Acinetobacter baumannii]